MAGGGTQQRQDTVQGTRRNRRRLRYTTGWQGADASQQHFRHFFHRQDMGGVTGPDGAGRHAVVFRCGWFLHQRDAASAEDGAQPQRAVGAGAGENDADSVLSLIVGQGTQEGVNRHALLARLFRHGELQHAVEDGHVAVGRDDIHAVGRHGHLVLRLGHQHGRAALQDFAEQAGVIRIEMRCQHEGHAAAGRHTAEELLEGIQPAGGSTHADYGERGRARFQ